MSRAKSEKSREKHFLRLLRAEMAEPRRPLSVRVQESTCALPREVKAQSPKFNREG
jgi:hypothetical protein